jgi:DNA-binding MarR family transcriptional regulator
VTAEFVDALRQTSRCLQSYLAAQARASGRGLIEYLVLVRAADVDGVTARDAARAFDLNTSTMTGLSDRLEQAKLVRRHPHSSDRRVRVLKATPQGRRAVARTTGPLLSELEQVAAALLPDQRTAIATILQQITTRIVEATPETRPRQRAPAVPSGLR